MKKLLTLLLVAALACLSNPSKSRAENVDGAENYALKCAACHNPGPGHPATMLLAEKGRPVPSLIGRKDLELDYLQTVVRNGLIEMPPFRPTELSDAQIKAIYTYVTHAKEAPKESPAMPPAKQEPAK